MMTAFKRISTIGSLKFQGRSTDMVLKYNIKDNIIAGTLVIVICRNYFKPCDKRRCSCIFNHRTDCLSDF